ncbi:MAG: signal peptidase I, partial [Oscillospiraceae bacterium]|nr:signal peptidase I [Oscillospiraceae bacterium]
MKALKKVATIIVSVILWAVILLAALFAFTTLATRDNTHVASVFGYTPMVVQTESMSPTFDAEDMIIIRQCDPSTLQVGDIITFHTIIENEYALNTHRIVEISNENGIRGYTTRGDNNNGVDDRHIISDSDIVGQYVTRLPKMGKVINFLSGSVGFLVVIVLPMLAFFIYQIYHLITVSIKLKKAVALENAQAAASVNEDKLAEAEKA